jgi:hypothetical protein
MVLKRVGVWSAAKLSGVLYGSIGLIIGAIFALMSFMGVSLPPSAYGESPPPTWLAPILGVGAIVFLPLLYGVMGVVVGAVSAALFNFFARLAGGLEVELE